MDNTFLIMLAALTVYQSIHSIMEMRSEELYYYLDSTPAHSYMKGSVQIPTIKVPVQGLVEENRRRGKRNPEFELIDTDAIDDDRYFDQSSTQKPTPAILLIRCE